MSGKEMAKAMSNFVNVLDYNKRKEFISTMTKEHRALQEEFTDVCVLWLREIAKYTDMQIDARNVSSVAKARLMIKGLDKDIS